MNDVNNNIQGLMEDDGGGGGNDADFQESMPRFLGLRDVLADEQSPGELTITR